MRDLNANYYIASNPRWRATRKLFLAENPLCVFCKDKGRLTPATEVDHIIERRDLESIGAIYDQENLRALCKPCHSRRTMLHRNMKKEPVALDWNGCGRVGGVENLSMEK